MQENNELKVFLHVREHGDDSAEVVGVGEIAEAGI